MKKTSLILSGFISMAVLIGCGNNSDINDMKEAVKMAKKAKKQIKQAKKNKGKTAEQVGKEALTALKNGDYKTVKSLVEPAAALNMDTNYLNNQKERNLKDWDGKIRGVKYRKSKLRGTQEAVVYFTDIDDSTISVHVLGSIGSSGKQWYAFGGSYPFEEMKKKEYEALSEELKSE